jgi:hypothetical protein
MNIIIPIGGEGKRFIDNGYNEIKPLIFIFLEIIFFDNISFIEKSLNVL